MYEGLYGFKSLLIFFSFLNISYIVIIHVLNHNFSKPQQLSTFALTLFNYQTEVNKEKVSVGKFFDAMRNMLLLFRLFFSNFKYSDRLS